MCAYCDLHNQMHLDEGKNKGKEENDIFLHKILLTTSDFLINDNNGGRPMMVNEWLNVWFL